MRPQFNIPMDDYPELPEKIRKLCKVRGYRISDFCSRVLSEAVERETSELSNYEPTEQRLNRIESELAELRSLMGSYNKSFPEPKSSVLQVESIVPQLRDLLNRKKYPVGKLRTRLAEIIKENT